MQHEKQEQDAVISTLRRQVEQLSSRLAERGVDVSTERKMIQWKEEVLAQLPQGVQLSSDQQRAAESQAHRLKLLENNTRMDVDRISHDIASLRSVVLRMENELAGVTSSEQTLARGVTQAQRLAENATDAFKLEARHLALKFASHDELDVKLEELRLDHHHAVVLFGLICLVVAQEEHCRRGWQDRGCKA